MSAGRKGYLVFDPTLGALLHAALWRFFGWEIAILNPAPPPSHRARAFKRLRASEVVVEKCETLILGPEAYAGPSRAALRVASDEASSCEPSPADSGWSTPPSVIARARTLSTRFEEATIADAWARMTERARIYPPSRDMRLILKGMGTPAHICQRGPAFPLRFVSIAFKRRLQKVDSSERPPATAHRAPGDSVCQGMALMVLNRDVSYNALFSYDQLLPTDPLSAWAPSRVAYISAGGGTLANGELASSFPPALSRFAILRRSKWALLDFLRRPRGLKFAWERLVLQERAEAAASYFRHHYPNALGALMAFDIQIPAHIVLGLELAGIRTMSLQERPALCFDMVVTSITGRMLTASEFFGEQVETSQACSVRSTSPIGLWRTDLIVTHPQFKEGLRFAARPLVLVLPYHVDAKLGRSDDPVCTAYQSVDAFLQDVAYIADRHPECDFVIRAKNSQWIHDKRLQTTRESLIALGNVTLDDDYSSLNRSYDLAAKSTLIIAKPTSMVDEALACGIPCVLHDFTHNQSVYGRPLLRYLPEEFWATNREELLSRVNLVLSDPQGFRRRWEPFLRAVFGNWADGRVRARLHAELEHLLVAPQ